MGVANKRSIAWGIAAAFHREGAELAFTYQNDRLKENLDELLDGIGGRGAFATFPCDVQSDEQLGACFAALADRWGRLDTLVHCIAFADREDLTRPFHEMSRAGYALALDVSAYSLIAAARHAAPLMVQDGGGSILTLTYNAVERVVSGYNAMAVAKAALEAEVRYLAAELGPRQIRVNAISAGPLKTLAGSAVKGISRLRDLTAEISPLRRNITQEEVGDVAVFLASDLARAVTGNTIFVDSGFHIIGVPTIQEQ
ncbi:MAG: enoyl-ACP reductase [Armatimonadetes bacterium]|nr:enoyl-ACP reductase [Armatimonadota bacterium]